MTAGPTKSLAQLGRIEKKLGIGNGAEESGSSNRNSPALDPPRWPFRDISEKAVAIGRPSEPWAPTTIAENNGAQSKPLRPAMDEREPVAQSAPKAVPRWTNWPVVIGALLAMLILPILGKFAWLRLLAPLDAVLVAVPDGDSLDIRIGGAPTSRVDVADISAPDRITADGVRAQEELEGLLRGKEIRIWPAGKTPQGRLIVMLEADRNDVGHAMVLRGAAMPCPYLMRDPLVSVFAALARILGRGIWNAAADPSPDQFKSDTSCTPLQEK